MSSSKNTAQHQPPPTIHIKSISIEKEMQQSYLAYAMSVIIARALPDARDGLKPVHRRILHAMNEGGYTSGKPYRKSARIVGDVIGKYHPHGEAAIYEAMVRLVQDFSMRLPLLDGQGNFGSLDGDKPAAMRYTEIRLKPPAEALLSGIKENTVDFKPNYDSSETEPSVLPAAFPNLLVNGASGIAVGMATNIPPYNLNELIDATLALIETPSLQREDLAHTILGPDFPTGGIILGKQGIHDALMTGRGTISMRGQLHTERADTNSPALIITEIPYQLNKARLIETIAMNVRKQIIEGVADLRDESNKEGVRIVIELKRGYDPAIIENTLYKYTPLQSSFGINMVALNEGRPQRLNIKELLSIFIDFRKETLTRRTQYRLDKARARAHLLLALGLAVANLDEMVALIKSAKDTAHARTLLMEKPWPLKDCETLVTLIEGTQQGKVYHLSEVQARGILDLRLNRLTALGREEIEKELRELATYITRHLDILMHEESLVKLMKEELQQVKENFGTPRRTEISDQLLSFEEEHFIQKENMVVTLSDKGYVKRVPLSTYKPQKRGGKGRIGAKTVEEDFLREVYVVSTHDDLLMFSNLGRVYKIKAYRLPQALPHSKGKALQNKIPLAEKEKIRRLLVLQNQDTSSTNGLEALALEPEQKKLFIIFATAFGKVRRNAIEDFEMVRANGKIAMKLQEDDRIVGVDLCGEDHKIVLTNREGKAICFKAGDVRTIKSRNSSGVNGMRLKGNNKVVSMSVLEARSSEAPASSKEAFFMLTITENGYGKLTAVSQYRIQRRGGTGVITIKTSKRNGRVIFAAVVKKTDQLMLMTNKGQVIRSPIKGIRAYSRNTQGVILFRVAKDERVVAASVLDDKILLESPCV